jgi:predicted nucleic acid-binding protein
MTFVLDSSAALSWCFEDEASTETEALLERVRVEGAHVPDLWHVEMANVLTGAERRGRLSRDRVIAFLGQIARLPLLVDRSTSTRAFTAVRDLALAERLTAYDAVYLDMAKRRTLPLATKDDDLRAAAARHGIELLP